MTTDRSEGAVVADPGDAQTDVQLDLNRDDAAADQPPRLRERLEGVDVNVDDGSVDVNVE